MIETATPRFRCQGATKQSKQCKSHTAKGAAPDGKVYCDLHAHQHGTQVAKVTNPRHICQGRTSTGDQWKASVAKPPFADGKVYCILHAHQQEGAPPLRHCDGIKQNLEACLIPLPTAPTWRPSFCAHHQLQREELKFIVCFGKDANGARCGKLLKWQPPFFQFCADHASQAESFGCAITTLPDDLSTMILDLITPVERVAFALANKSCAALVKSWGRKQQASDESRTLTYKLAIRLDPYSDWAENKDMYGIECLLGVVCKYPFLFPSTLGLCLNCQRQLNAKDSAAWSCVFPPTLTKLAAMKAKREPEPATVNGNIETLIYLKCIDLVKKVNRRGVAYECDFSCDAPYQYPGRPERREPLKLARSYWTVQKNTPPGSACSKS